MDLSDVELLKQLRAVASGWFLAFVSFFSIMLLFDVREREKKSATLYCLFYDVSSLHLPSFFTAQDKKYPLLRDVELLMQMFLTLVRFDRGC